MRLSRRAAQRRAAIRPRRSVRHCSSPLFPSTLSSQAADIVLYASDVTTIVGNWSRLLSTTGAGGQKMTSVDRGWSTPNALLAAPVDYFEATFTASARAASTLRMGRGERQVQRVRLVYLLAQ